MKPNNFYSLAITALILSGCATKGDSDFIDIAPIPYVESNYIAPSQAAGNLGIEEVIPNLQGLTPPLYAKNLAPQDISGGWTLADQDQSCKIVTPQTPINDKFRAKALNCWGSFSKLASWDIKDKKVLSFYDSKDKVLAQFYSTRLGQFSGVDNNGNVLTLKR